MEPPYNSTPKTLQPQWTQYLIWWSIILFFIFLFWGSFRVYRHYSPFVIELTLTDLYSNTVISANQYYYSGLLKFFGTASPLQVSLDTVTNYFPSGTTQRNDSYSIVMLNTTSNPVYVCFPVATYTLSSTITGNVLNGTTSYFVLAAKTSILLSMAYVNSSSVILF